MRHCASYNGYINIGIIIIIIIIIKNWKIKLTRQLKKYRSKFAFIASVNFQIELLCIIYVISICNISDILYI